MQHREQWVPHEYQRKAIRFAVKNSAAALLLDLGMGKTGIAASTFIALKKAGVVNRALVIAPRRPCYSVWSNERYGELGRWENFSDIKISLLHGRHKEDALEEEADLYVINFEGIKWLLESGGLRTRWARDIDMLIVDELSKFKHPRSQRFKLMRPHLGRFKRRLGLTGSPASNGLIDLFGQMYVVDQGETLGRYITHYRHKYFVPSGFGGYTWKLQDGAEEKIRAAIKPHSLSMRAKDHLDMPMLVERDIWVDLPDKAARIYHDIEEEFFALIDDQTVTAVNAAVASRQCRQVASGSLYKPIPMGEPKLTAKRQVIKIHDAKIEALKDLVEEMQGSPLLVAYSFDHDYQSICDGLGYTVPALRGGTSDKVASKIIAEWNAGEIPVLCGHPAAMGHGLNLQQSGNHICWYSLTWDYELYVQLNGRVYRQGSKAKRVFIHRLLARNTIDEAVASAIVKKGRVQDTLLDSLRRYRAERRR